MAPAPKGALTGKCRPGAQGTEEEKIIYYICHMRIGIASDHAGYEFKARIVRWLTDKGLDIKDFGTDSLVSVDYPDYAHALAQAIEKGDVDCGIALCGSGNGMAITLNKHQGIRAGLAWNSEIARLVKAHNNANVIVLPARFISYAMAQHIINTWITTQFDGGRHQRRIDKIPLR